MTLISTGTWIVVMAPGTPVEPLQERGGDDVLANVSVRGEPVPTARFMGGRDVERLCAGADPSLADMATLRQLDDAGVRVADDGSHVALRRADARHCWPDSARWWRCAGAGRSAWPRRCSSTALHTPPSVNTSTAE